MSFIRLKAPVKRAEEKGMSEVMISQRRPLSRQTVTAEEMVSRVERALLDRSPPDAETGPGGYS
jgi:hypothetical protein